MEAIIKKITYYDDREDKMKIHFNLSVKGLIYKDFDTEEEALCSLEKFKESYFETKKTIIKEINTEKLKASLVLEIKWGKDNWYLVSVNEKFVNCYTYYKDISEEDNNKIAIERFLKTIENYQEPTIDVIYSEEISKIQEHE
jgi:hypothetical protein